MGSNLVTTAMSLLVVVPFILYYELSFGIHFLYLAAGLLISAVLALGLGLMLPIECRTWRYSTPFPIHHKGWILSIASDVDFENDSRR